MSGMVLVMQEVIYSGRRSYLLVAKVKIKKNLNLSFFFKPTKQIIPCEGTAEKVSFEW